MPHEVIMPALGMAQDTGQILAWHKKPGEAVAEGDVLFEVETDKAAMEVEAQSEGYLTDVTAEAGSDVPVGQVIARISETPNGAGQTPEPHDTPEELVTAAAPAIPEGREVIMPTLGMAQDTGLLIGWQKQPGDAVSADDVLFEVETDKSTVEVNAGFDGFIAALLAEAGEEVPVGQAIAIISSDKPDKPIAQSAKSVSAVSKPSQAQPPEEENPAVPAQPVSAVPTAKLTAARPRGDGRVLASPKARRLALEQGLDLALLAEAGHPQPFHVKDLDVLKSLPRAEASAQVGMTRRLTADVPGDAYAEFVGWASDEMGLRDGGAVLAGLAAASLGRVPANVAVETFGTRQTYTVPSVLLGSVVKADPEADADVLVRDLRFSRISSLHLGSEDCPVISIMHEGSGLHLTLECAGNQLTAMEAVNLLSNFAGSMEQPLRHLL